MFSSLYQYLVLNQRLNLPGLGTIKLQRHPAQYDVAEKSFSAPAYNFAFISGEGYPSKKLFEFLAKEKSITEWDAIRMVNDFAYELNKSLLAGKEIKWEPVGNFRKDESGNIVLDSPVITPGNEPAVVAEKVIRENAQHTMLVGERERTSTEMESMLTDNVRHKRSRIKESDSGHEQKKKDPFLLIAIILTMLAFIFIIFYFSQKRFRSSSTGNQVKFQSVIVY